MRNDDYGAITASRLYGDGSHWLRAEFYHRRHSHTYYPRPGDYLPWHGLRHLTVKINQPTISLWHRHPTNLRIQR